MTQVSIPCIVTKELGTKLSTAAHVAGAKINDPDVGVVIGHLDPTVNEVLTFPSVTIPVQIAENQDLLRTKIWTASPLRTYPVDQVSSCPLMIRCPVLPCI
ncbi:MAG: hypothetical protein WCJ39_01380 [bacterium]